MLRDSGRAASYSRSKRLPRQKQETLGKAPLAEAGHGWTQEGDMVSIDENEVKRVSAALDAQRLRTPLAAPSSKSLRKNSADVEKTFASYFAKTGLPIDKLNKLAAKSKAERRKLIDRRGDESAKASRAAEAAFHQGMAYRRQALQLLSKPFLSTLITLDKPFLIWELPHPESNVWIELERRVAEQLHQVRNHNAIRRRRDDLPFLLSLDQRQRLRRRRECQHFTRFERRLPGSGG